MSLRADSNQHTFSKYYDKEAITIILILDENTECNFENYCHINSIHINQKYFNVKLKVEMLSLPFQDLLRQQAPDL